MKTQIASLAILALAAIGSAQTAAPAPSLWNGQFAYDFAVNKSLALVSYSVGTAHSPLILPQWSFSALTFAGSYVGSSGVGGGVGLQLSTMFHGITMTAGYGQAMFSGSKGPHSIVFFGGSIPVK